MRGVAVAPLGPDVLAGDFDSRHAASRAAAAPERTIGETLLDQRVAAGIGNIWKCESLFACGIDPRTPIGALSLDQLAALYQRSARAHDGERARQPADVSRLQPDDKPCLTCQAPIEVAISWAHRPVGRGRAPTCQAAHCLGLPLAETDRAAANRVVRSR